MRIAVIGAGAIGCFVASRLHLAGHVVTLVGRPPQVEAIRRGGLLVHDGRTPRRFDLAAETRLAQRPELLLLTVKTHDLERACRDVQPRADGVPAVALQNGIRADAIAGAVLGPEVVVGGVAMCPATYLEPGQVSVDLAGWLVLGQPAGGSPAHLRTATRALGSAIPTYVSPKLVGTRWAKLISNLNNGLCAATGLPLPALAREARARWLPVHVMREGQAVARAAGVHLDHHVYGLGTRSPRAAMLAVLQPALSSWLGRVPPAVSAWLLGVAAGGPLGRLAIRGSTWQSLARGRPTEIDYLNGEIVRVGAALGVPTPFNARVVDVIHEVERTGRFRPPADLWPRPAGRPAGTRQVVAR